MKKIFLFTFLVFLFSFSYSINLVSDYDKVPSDLFFDMYDYAKGNLDNSYYQAYKVVANKFGLKSYVVKAIYKGRDYYCLKNFDKLGIKPDKDGNYKPSDFVSCKNKIKKAVDNYVQSNLIKLSVDDALKGENVLADGDEENSSYDLLVDFKNLTEILFKKEIKLNTKFDLLASNGKSSGSNGNGQNSKNVLQNDTNINGTNLNGAGSKDNLSGDNNLFGNIENAFSNNQNGSLNQNDEVTDSNNEFSNLPIGNKCAGNLKDYQKEKLGDTSGQNSNGNINHANSNNNGVIIGNNGKKTYIDQGFNVFGEKGYAGLVDSGDISVSPSDLGLSNPSGGGAGGSKSCPGDGLLSICVKLVPSGPRGPVGGTTKKRSIEEVINKISDTLKEMRYAWIIVAGHGDEALDIDFKHINLADIFAFNIILTPKPVFNFKKDKEVIKQENLPDTELENVPRKLAKIYSDLNIVDGFNPQADFKKYLITDLDNVQPYKEVQLNYPENVDTNSSKGIFAEEENYKELTRNILNMLDAMEKMTKSWVGSSIALYEKSTF